MNLKVKEGLFLAIGIVGAIITLYGSSADTPARLFYVLGSSLLILTAFYFQLVFFIALELIMISGHGAVLLNIGSVIQVALPVLLCMQLLFFYYLSDQLNSWFLLTGITGIAALSVGLTYENQWIFLLGSSAIAIYAFSCSGKNRITLLWGILNSLFACIALFKIITL